MIVFLNGRKRVIVRIKFLNVTIFIGLNNRFI